MARMLWLADVLRAAGLTVVEVAGWRERGSTDFDPRGVIIHETRGSVGSSETGEINVLINGRVGLSGPISQLFLGRDGRWHVIAGGRCNHVMTGWSGPFANLGNSRLLGIEAHWTPGEPWTPQQYGSYVRGVAAILRHTGWPAPVGHKEHQSGDKPDPVFDMNQFRREVAAIGIGDDMTEKASRVVEAWSVGLTKTPLGEQVEPVLWRLRDEAWQRKVDAALAADEARDKAVLAAVTALANAGGIDAAPIVAAINAVKAEVLAKLDAVPVAVVDELANELTN